MNQLKTKLTYLLKRRFIITRIIQRLSKITLDGESDFVLKTIGIFLEKTCLELDSHKTLNELINNRSGGFYESLNDFLHLSEKCQCGNESKIRQCPFDIEIHNCVNYCNCCENCSHECQKDI